MGLPADDGVSALDSVFQIADRAEEDHAITLIQPLDHGERGGAGYFKQLGFKL